MLLQKSLVSLSFEPLDSLQIHATLTDLCNQIFSQFLKKYVQPLTDLSKMAFLCVHFPKAQKTDTVLRTKITGTNSQYSFNKNRESHKHVLSIVTQDVRGPPPGFEIGSEFKFLEILFGIHCLWLCIPSPQILS